MVELDVQPKPCYSCGSRPTEWRVRWWAHNKFHIRAYCLQCLPEMMQTFVEHGDGAQRLEAVRINGTK